MKNRTKAIILALLFAGVLTNCEQPTDNPGTKIENPDQTEKLPVLKIGTATATMTNQSGNAYAVSITVPAGATASQINLTDGSNFAFNGKTFNLDITFADGTYNDDMVNAIKGKFTAKGGAVGTTITTPEKPQQPVVALPVLTVGAATANITKDSQDANIFNVSITIPNGAAPGNVGLTDGSNFAFAGKTFNLDITFAGGTYNDDMVDAIKGKVIIHRHSRWL